MSNNKTGFILKALLTAAILTVPIAGAAQDASSIPRIGLLSPSAASDPRTTRYFDAFRQGLREHGYVDGQNILIEIRWADGKYERLAELATELAQLKVKVIVTYSAPAIRVAKQTTSTIPIVMAFTIDPVATGFVTSLARPEGNLTGLSLMAPDLIGKQLEVLREIVPNVSRVAVLGNAANVGNAPQLRLAQEAARTAGIQLQLLNASAPGEIDGAFAAMTAERAGAVVVLADPMLIDQRARIAELASRRNLPSVGGQIEYAEAGGLVSYGPSFSDMFRRSATYVHRLLTGAKPAALPIEQPTKFEVVVNMKTAKTLGLAIPQSLLVRADQVIQ